MCVVMYTHVFLTNNRDHSCTVEVVPVNCQLYYLPHVSQNMINNDQQNTMVSHIAYLPFGIQLYD
jgi:hypothetical protein